MNYKFKYLDTNYKEDSIILVEILFKIFRGEWQIPFSNRAPSWDIIRAAAYLNFVMSGNTLGYGTIWHPPKDLVVPIQSLLANPPEYHKIKGIIDKYVLDSGNRIRLFVSIIFNQGVLEAQDKDMRENGFKLSFNPFTGKIAPTKKDHLNDKQWITNLSELWSCWDKGLNEIQPFIIEKANTFLRHNGVLLNEVGNAFTNEDKITQELVTLNIGKFVEILFCSITYTTVYSKTEEDAYEIFVGTNENENISLLNHIHIGTNIIDHEYFLKLKTFAKDVAGDWFKNCEDDTFTVFMGLLSKKLNKSGKDWQKALANTSKKDRRRYINLLTYEQNFYDFLCNVLFPFGCRKPNTYTLASPLTIPHLYTLYIDGLFNNVSRDILFRELKILFLTFGSMTKKFPQNHAIRISELLQALNRSGSSIEYRNILIEKVREIEAIQTRGLKDEYLYAKSGNCIQLSNSTAVECYRGAGLLFTPLRKITDNLQTSHRHHLHAVLGINLPDHLKNSPIIQNAMNKCWISPDYNRHINTSDPMSYFSIFCKGETNRLNAELQGLNPEMFCFDEELNEGLLLELFEEIARNKANVTLETLELIKQGK